MQGKVGSLQCILVQRWANGSKSTPILTSVETEPWPERTWRFFVKCPLNVASTFEKATSKLLVDESTAKNVIDALVCPQYSSTTPDAWRICRFVQSQVLSSLEPGKTKSRWWTSNAPSLDLGAEWSYGNQCWRASLQVLVGEWMSKFMCNYRITSKYMFNRTVLLESSFHNFALITNML